MTALYLASTSPRRRGLLRRLGLGFRVLAPHPKQELAVLVRNPRCTPRRIAIACARAKALSVVPRVRSGIILGVDTVVVVDGSILGKPESKSDARRMLRMLSGRSHSVTSGVAVVRVPGGQMLTAAETTRVTFRNLSPREIESYIATPEPYDKAGAYGIQERAGVFVSRVCGCYLNVVGLPVGLVLALLKRAGLKIPRLPQPRSARGSGSKLRAVGNSQRGSKG